MPTSDTTNPRFSRKLLTIFFIGTAFAQETSIQIPATFDAMVTKDEARAMGLDKATAQQKKAFTEWAIRFSTGIIQQQHDADMRAFSDLLDEKLKQIRERR